MCNLHWLVLTIVGLVGVAATAQLPMMCPAWHDCMHNNPLWLPANTPPTEQVWRLRIYARENDPDALLARVAQDFPNAKHAACE